MNPSKKSKIRITSSTLGTVVDAGIKDAFHMGAVMAPAAAKTIYTHLTNTKTKASDYDLILTGDLGRYGKDILKKLSKRTLINHSRLLVNQKLEKPQVGLF